MALIYLNLFLRYQTIKTTLSKTKKDFTVFDKDAITPLLRRSSYFYHIVVPKRDVLGVGFKSLIKFIF